MIWHRAWSRVSAGIVGRTAASRRSERGAEQGRIPAVRTATSRTGTTRHGAEVDLGLFVQSPAAARVPAWNARRSERLWRAMRAERERLGIDALATVDGEVRRVRG